MMHIHMDMIQVNLCFGSMRVVFVCCVASCAVRGVSVAVGVRAQEREKDACMHRCVGSSLMTVPSRSDERRGAAPYMHAAKHNSSNKPVQTLDLSCHIHTCVFQLVLVFNFNFL